MDKDEDIHQMRKSGYIGPSVSYLPTGVITLNIYVTFSLHW